MYQRHATHSKFYVRQKLTIKAKEEVMRTKAEFRIAKKPTGKEIIFSFEAW